LAIHVGQPLKGEDVVAVRQRLHQQLGLVAECIQIIMGARSTARRPTAWPATSTSRWSSLAQANRQLIRTPYSEPVNGSFRQECLNVHWFLLLPDAPEKIEHRRQEYNGCHPHSSLQHLTPDEVVVAATTAELQNA
jgi:putative transposase